MALKLKIFNNSTYSTPKYQSEGAAGLDLIANINEPLEIKPHTIQKIPTGIFLEIPAGYEAQIRARSGLSFKHGITLVNGIGTIDSDYRGEIQILLINLIETPYVIKPGERIAQMVISKYERVVFEPVDSVEELTMTKRGDGGFGHSGS